MPPSQRITSLKSRGSALDQLIAIGLQRLAFPCLRIMLGIVFVWFGGLKVAGVSPVKAMVAGTIPWGDPDVVMPVLGGVEVILGIALISGVALRIALPLLAAHLAGTFLTFVMLPAQMFRDSDPLLLTQDGEFVTKNLILICATLVLIVHSQSAPIPASAPPAQS